MLDQLRRDIQTHLSRWIAGVLRNEPLAADIAGAEAGLSADSPTETVEDARHALVTALQARHVRWR